MSDEALDRTRCESTELLGIAGIAGVDGRVHPYSFESNHDRAVRAAASPSHSAGSRPLEQCSDKIVDLAIICLTKDSLPLLENLIPSLEAISQVFSARRRSVRIILVDTGSTDLAAIDRLILAENSVEVVWTWNYNFSRSNNAAALNARARFFLFLNNDVEFVGKEGVVFDHLRLMESEPELDVVGTRLLYPSGMIQHDGVDFLEEPETFGLPYHPNAGSKPEIREELRFVEAVTGAYMMVRAVRFWEVGGFDSAYRRECQDVDLCLRIRQLGGLVGLTSSDLVHHENATRTKGEEDWLDRSVFLRRWTSFLRSAR